MQLSGLFCRKNVEEMCAEKYMMMILTIKQHTDDSEIELEYTYFTEYQFDGTSLEVTDDMKTKFDKYGCVIVRKLLAKEEVGHIMNSFESTEFKEHAYGVDDGDGRKAHMTIWNQPGDDISGMVGRCEKVVSTCEKLLGGEIYHYHSKLMGKPPHEGGRHLWHQDYGYWYQNGCLFPYMMTVCMAMDKCEKANGCLHYLPGSNRCGRIEHHRKGGQFEADSERVAEITKQCPLQYAELDAGDALFMHCNVLHSSNPNLSEFRRWALLCCYNRADNDPVIPHHHAQFTPLKKVADTDILKCSKIIDVDGKAFMGQGDKTSMLAKHGVKVYAK